MWEAKKLALVIGIVHTVVLAETKLFANPSPIFLRNRKYPTFKLEERDDNDHDIFIKFARYCGSCNDSINIHCGIECAKHRFPHYYLYRASTPVIICPTVICAAQTTKSAPVLDLGFARPNLETRTAIPR